MSSVPVGLGSEVILDSGRPLIEAMLSTKTEVRIEIGFSEICASVENTPSLDMPSTSPKYPIR